MTKESAKVLDIGFGTGTLTTKLYENGCEVYGQDFSQITVKGLCAGTSVARTTFYSYFENTSDVLEAVEDDIVKGLKELPIKVCVCGGNLKKIDFHAFLT